MSNRWKFLVMTILAVSACASDGGEATEAVGGQRAGDAGSAETANPAYDAVRPNLAEDLKLLASQERIRPANFYKLERSYEPAVCDAALKSLNKPYAVPDGLAKEISFPDSFVEKSVDEAQIEAAYTLGTSDNVRWSAREVRTNSIERPRRLMEVATIDLFGEGVDRVVTRDWGLVSSQILVALSVPGMMPDGSILFDGISLHSATHGDKSLGHNAFEFPILDVIKIGDRYYILTEGPPRDHGRVYFIKLTPPLRREDGSKIRDQAHLLCTFAPQLPSAQQ